MDGDRCVSLYVCVYERNKSSEDSKQNRDPHNNDVRFAVL